MGLNVEFKKLLVLFTAVTLLITLLMFFNKPYSVKAETKKEFTGEEIYRGVVFGQGKVAKELPQIWDVKKMQIANSKENTEVVNKIIMEIKAKDSIYFKRLEQSIKTKDFVAIKKEFEYGSILLKNTVENLNFNVQTQKNTQQNDIVNSALSKIQIVVLPAVLPNGIVLNNISNIVIFTGFGNESELEKEKLIQDISNNIIN
ncbi:sporulation delaying protein family toxin [Bacillus mycoides]|uniref:sporulation delaying protein family toxin n=1 Tax=Bacillus mycoides TaxID=1405 RepID=UPI003D1BFDA7